MVEAYAKVSGGGQLPANARQLMYAARPHIQERTGRKLEDNYFTQTLLPDYIDKHDAEWDVIYDARGHFTEPHSSELFGIGTLEVRQYLCGLAEPRVVDAHVAAAKVETKGPSGSFGAVLFIEKEGFDPILRAARIAERFDIAIMSTKGMSVTAGRDLADEMCSEYDIPLLVLHDFDKAGFSIAGTLRRDTRRYTFDHDLDVIDLGLRLDDVEEMGLESEYQYLKVDRVSLERNLRANGASETEIAFMFGDFTNNGSVRRVELNAMTSPQFVSFIERKLDEAGITKVIPDDDVLACAYVGVKKGQRFAEATREIHAEIASSEGDSLPDDLEEQVRAMLEEDPALRWDAAVAQIANRSEPASQ